MPLCTAKSSQSGKPCKRHAIAGGTVCPTHGGSAPRVKEAAKRRLLELVDPALAVLARSMKQSPPPDRKKFATDAAYETAVLAHFRDQIPAAVALKAATEVLDRADIDTENKAVMGGGTIAAEIIAIRKRRMDTA